GHVGFLHEDGFACRFFPFALFGVVSPVDDMDAAVVVERVVGRGFTEPLFELEVETGYFVPGAEVFVRIERGDGISSLRNGALVFDREGRSDEPYGYERARADNEMFAFHNVF